MTENDISEILALLEVYYPSYFKDKNVPQIELMTKVWTEKFKNYTPSQLKIAVDRLSSKSSFMPSVAEIIEEMEVIRNPVLRNTAEEEWEIVIESMRKHGHYRASEAYKMFSPLTKEIVNEIGYYNLCTSELIQADRKRFMELYNTKIKLFKELKVLGSTITLHEHEKLLELTNMMELDTINLPLLGDGKETEVIKKVEIKD